MTARNRTLLPYALLFLLPATLHGEQRGRAKPPLETESERLLAGFVLSSEGSPLPDAAVEVTADAETPCGTARTDTQGRFQADGHSCAKDGDKAEFTLVLHVSKKGFQHAHKLVVKKLYSPVNGITVTLRPLQQKNPDLLSQAELIAHMSRRLRQAGTDEGLSAEAQRDFARGVSETLESSQLDSAVLLLHKVARSHPSCVKCRTMLALAEVLWGDRDDARKELEESIQASTTDQRPVPAEPLLLYGVLLSWELKPARAGEYFSEALKRMPQDAFTLQELGRSQFMDAQWEAASLSLKQALDAGAGTGARLMLAEALLKAGETDSASAELTAYLEGGNIRNATPKVRALSEQIRTRMNEKAASRAPGKPGPQQEKPVDYMKDPPQDLSDFEPAKDQEPLAGILSATGNSVAKLFANLLNVSTIEKVQLERLEREGKAHPAREFEYMYLCVGSVDKRIPYFDEYRSDAKGRETSQSGLDKGYMLTSGFVAAPLVLHPVHQSGNAFRLLGHQRLNGRNTAVLAYAQIPSRSQISGIFRDGKNVATTYKQGMVWIDTENFQILRLVSDLLTPLPQVRLERLSTEINFDAVQSDNNPQKFWLPVQVAVTVHWNGGILRNTHAYSDFKLFNVEATQKIEKPIAAENTADGVGDADVIDQRSENPQQRTTDPKK